MTQPITGLTKTVLRKDPRDFFSIWRLFLWKNGQKKNHTCAMHATSICIQNDSWDCLHKERLSLYRLCHSGSISLDDSRHAWQTVLCLFCFSHWKWRYLTHSLPPPPGFTVFLSLHPLVLISTALKDVFRRMFTKRCLIWMMHLCFGCNFISNFFKLDFTLPSPLYRLCLFFILTCIHT